jgi:uncharacterized protein (DUF885 family)
VQAPAGASPPASAAVVDAAAESQRLHALVDEYFEQQLELNPLLATSIGDPRYNDRFEVSIAPEWRARAERVERDALARLCTIDRSRLTGQDLLSYDVFKSARELEIEGYRFPDHLLPLNQFYSTPNSFAMMGSGKGIHPFRTVKDYEDFLKRLDGFVAWTDQAIANMREGVTKGYTLPRVLTERILPQLEAHVVAAPEDSIYYGPVRDMPAGFAAADRDRLTRRIAPRSAGRVVPDLPEASRLHARRVPGAVPYHGWSRRTAGRCGLVRVQRADDHDHGLHASPDPRDRAQGGRTHPRRDARGHAPGQIRGRPEGLLGVHAEGPPVLLRRPREADCRLRRHQAPRRPALPKLFERMPAADYEVRAVEAFREKSAAGGSYQAASEDGSRPGVFYANTYDLKARPMWAMEALSLHEANPGHHFQISLQREQKDLPKFRRFSSYTAYSEGWGLYAESLGRELGLYEDPYQYFGMLEAELWRSIRLVVDTGLHSKGWTREQVLEYMDAMSSTAEARAVSEAERYIAIPGQALAYKIGQLKIRELRSRAEAELDGGFDVRSFHTAVLGDGPLPLDVLEAKLKRWIDDREQEAVGARR